MATQVQWRGGSTAEHATFTGAAREVTVDTQKQTLVVHDGSTVGGEALLREDQANLPGSVTNGIYTPGTNQVAVATNGTGRLFVDASGNVGIGNTTGLGGTLGVSGNISLSGNGTGTRYLGLMNETDTYAGSFTLQAGGGSSGFGGAITMYGHSHATYPGSVYIGTSAVSGGSIILGTNNALDPANEKVRITSAGLVGIGTSSPNNKFTLQDGNVLVRSEVTTGTSNSYHIGFSATSTGGVAATIGSYRENANEASALTFNTWNGTVFGERVRLDSSGRLLVGTSSVIAASPLLQVEQTTGAEIALGRQDTSVIVDDLMGGIGFWGRDTSGVAYTEQSSIKCFADGTHDPGTNPTRLVFSTTAGGASTPTERMRITSDAYVRLAAGTGGIQFGGDTAAANALDDYEEGTWTPIMADASSGGNTAASYAVNQGSYVKIGSSVTVVAIFTFPVTTSMTGGNELFIRGLPFISPNLNTGECIGSAITRSITLATGQTFCSPKTIPNSTNVQLMQCGSNTSETATLVSQVASSTALLRFTLTYIV
jgi:hypothetical protein